MSDLLCQSAKSKYISFINAMNTHDALIMACTCAFCIFSETTHVVTGKMYPQGKTYLGYVLP